MLGNKIPRGKISIPLKPLIKAFSHSASNLVHKSDDFVAQFETKFASLVEGRYAVSFNKARHAFYYLLQALNLPSNSEVIMTPIHVPAFVAVIEKCGHKPVFVDYKSNSFSINIDELKKKITNHTRVILVTHYYGMVNDMESIKNIADHHKLSVIEDCSQCILGKYNNSPVGSFGIASVYSLGFLKTCSTLNGGMMVTNNKELYDRVVRDAQNLTSSTPVAVISALIFHMVFSFFTSRLIFSYFTYYCVFAYEMFNRSKYTHKRPPHRSNRKHIGQGHRLSQIEANIGIGQIDRVRTITETQIAIGTYMRQNILNKDILPDVETRAANVFWLFPILCNTSEALRSFLLRKGIDTSPLTLPLLAYNAQQDTPIAYTLRANTTFIPIHYSFNRDEVDLLISSINNYCNHAH